MNTRTLAFVGSVFTVASLASATVRINTYQGNSSSTTSSTTVSSGTSIPISVDHQISRICILRMAVAPRITSVRSPSATLAARHGALSYKSS